MKQSKPLVPSLPGRYGRMTREELDAESNQYDVEFSGTDATRVANTKPHPKKRRRLLQPVSERPTQVRITMAPELLHATDAAAEKHALTRTGLIRQAVSDWLARQQPVGKSA